MDAKKRKIITIALIISIALAGLIGYRIYSNITANKERAARSSQGRAVAVEVGTVVRRDISPILSFSANLEPVWIAEISPKVDGRIDRLYVDEGDVVKAGMVIAVLDTNELDAQVVQAQGNLLSAKAGLEQAEIDLVRTQALAKENAVSAQALDTARIKRDLAIGQLRSAEGNMTLLNIRLSNANVVAPKDGIVVKRYLQSGYYAKTGAPIVSIADITSFLAKATVGEAQISELTVGLPAKITISALGNKEFKGVITRLSPGAALPARTFTAEITIANQEGLLKTGMFATVGVSGQVRPKRLAVPEAALVMREDQKSVFVVTADNKIQQKILKLGYVGGGWAEVLEGVNEGQRIVVAGQNKLRDGSTIDAPSAGGEK